MANAIMPQSNPYANAINAALGSQQSTADVLSMSSKEIADLTGKQHKHVLRDIKVMFAQIYKSEIDGPYLDHVDCKGVSVEKDARGYVANIHLDKDHTLTLLTGYDAGARIKVIRRWQELESREVQQQQPSLMTPEQQAVSSMQAWSQLGDIFACPKHIALQEGVKAVQARYGINLAPLLKASPYTDNIPNEDVMLEPTELGERLGFGKGKPAGEAINKLLEALGWQVKVGKVWEPTDMGAPHCAKHSWRTEFKSGYNYKWRLKDVEALLSVPSE